MDFICYVNILIAKNERVCDFMLNNLEWLLKMMNENPDLDVIPLVSNEVFDLKEFKLVADDRYIASLGVAEIQMYLKGQNGIRLYSDCSYNDTLIEFGSYTQKQCDEMNDQELENAYNNLPWQQAIFLNIDWVED